MKIEEVHQDFEMENLVSPQVNAEGSSRGGGEREDTDEDR